MNKLLPLIIAVLAIPALSAVAADGKAIYEKDCAKCHGADGKGGTKMGQKLGIKDYTDAKVQASFTDEQATKAIKEGVKKDGETKMKAFADLSDADVKALVAHIRAMKK